MKKFLLSLLLTTLLIPFIPSSAKATVITVSAGSIKNWTKTTSGSVTIKFELDQDGIDSNGHPRLRGTGPVVTATVAADPDYPGTYMLSVPSFSLDSTIDWVRPKNARYNAFFVLPNGQRIQWTDFTGSKVSNVANPTTFADISVYNKSAAHAPDVYYTYTRDEIDFKIAEITPLTNPMTAVGDIIRGGTVSAGVAAPVRLAIGTNGQFLMSNGTIPVWADLGSSYITTALGYTPENAANKNASGGYAGLSSGKLSNSQGAEVWALNDLSNVSGSPALNDVLTYNGSAWVPQAAGAGSGTVTSVGLTVPGILSVSGSPVTTNGTLAVSLATQTANIVFAGPSSGGAATPTFRSLVATDIPNLPASIITSGSIANARVAEVLAMGDLTNADTTGLATNQMLHYNGTNFVPLGSTANNTTLGTSTNVLRSALFASHTPSADLTYSASYSTVDPQDYWYWAYAVPGPGKVAYGFRSDFNAGSHDGGADFNLISRVTNAGRRNAVAFGSVATMTAGQVLQANSATAWGANFNAFTENATGYAGAIGLEINYGNLGASTQSGATGLAVYAVPRVGGGTAAGTNLAAIAISTNGTDVDAPPSNGIIFSQNGSVAPVNPNTGSLIYAQGAHAGYGINLTTGVYALFGIDLADSTFGQAAIRMPYVNDATDTISGFATADQNNTSHYNLIKLGYANTSGFLHDTLELGDWVSVSSHGVERMTLSLKGNAYLWRITPTLNIFDQTTTQVNGIQYQVSAIKSSAYSVTLGDHYILCDSSGGGFTLTFPDADANGGQTYTIKVITGTGTVTLASVDTDTFDGSATNTYLGATGSAITIFSDGDNWRIVSKN